MWPEQKSSPSGGSLDPSWLSSYLLASLHKMFSEALVPKLCDSEGCGSCFCCFLTPTLPFQFFSKR